MGEKYKYGEKNKYSISITNEELVGLVYVKDIVKLLEEKGVQFGG